MSVPRTGGPEAGRSKKLSEYLKEKDRRRDGSLIPPEEMARRINTQPGYKDGPDDEKMTPDAYGHIRDTADHKPANPRKFLEAHAGVSWVEPNSNDPDWRRSVQGTGWDILTDKVGEKYADFFFREMERRSLKEEPEKDS